MRLSKWFQERRWRAPVLLSVAILSVVGLVCHVVAAPTSVICTVNNTSIQLVFNVTVDAVDAVDASFYTAKDLTTGANIDLATATLTLQGDQKTVDITGLTLVTGHTINITVKAGFKDSNGDPLVGTLTTSCPVADSTPPQYTKLDAYNTVLKVTFNEAMNATSVTNKVNYTATIIKTPAGTNLNPSINIDLTTVNTKFVYDVTDFTVTITGFQVTDWGNATSIPNDYEVQIDIADVTDAAGNTLNPNPTSHTAKVEDNSGPTVTKCSATGYPVNLPATPEDDRVENSKIVVTFSEEVQSGYDPDNPTPGVPYGDNPENFVVESPVGTRLNFATIFYTPGQKTTTLSDFTTTDGKNSPVALLDHTTYKAKVTNVKDLLGNAILNNGTTNACTGVVSVPPYIASCSGGNNLVTVTFSEPMKEDAALTNRSNYTLQSPTGSPVSISSVWYNATTRTASITPSSNLVTGNTYTVKVLGVSDRDDEDGNLSNLIPSDGASNVCSGAIQDNIIPRLIYAAADWTHVKLVFSEDMNIEDARNSSMYTIESSPHPSPCEKVPPATGCNSYSKATIQELTYDTATRTALLTVSPLASHYRVELNGLRDLAGNRTGHRVGDFLCKYYNATTDDCPPGNYDPFDTSSDTSMRHIGDGDFTPPTVSACSAEDDQIAGTTNIVINYSENVKADGSATAANTLANYKLETPTGTVIDMFDPDNGSVSILYSSTNYAATIIGLNDDVVSSGQDFRLTVFSVEDRAGNPIVKNGTTNVCEGTILDKQPPFIAACRVPDTTRAVVVFNESINISDAAVLTNYTVEEDTGTGYKVVALSSPAQSVTYDTSTLTSTISGLDLTSKVRVTVKNVRDLSGNVIVDNGKTNVCEVPDFISPRVKSARANVTSLTDCAQPQDPGPARVEVFFSESVVSDGGANAANNKQNFKLESPDGNVVFDYGATDPAVSVVYDGAARKVTITGIGLVQGDSFTVSVKNVNDIAVPSNIILDDGVSNVGTGTVGDKVPPTVVSCVAGPNKLLVGFCEPVNATDAVDRNKFILESPTGTTKDLTNPAISFSYISGSAKTVITLPNGLNLVKDNTFKVKVQNLRDLAGNTVVNNNVTNVCSGVVTADNASPPEIESCNPSDSAHLVIVFSADLNPATIPDTNNYTVTPTLVVTQAELTGPKEITLTTEPQANGQAYTVTVTGVESSQGIPIQAGSKDTCDFTGKDTTSPNLTSCSLPDDMHVLLEFNEQMDATTGGDPANYSISSALNVSAAAVQAAPNSNQILLTVARQTMGVDYTVTVKDIQDTAGNTVNPNPSTCNFTGIDTTPPMVAECIAGRRTVLVKFSEDVDMTTALTKGNYTLQSPTGTNVAIGTVEQDPVNPTDTVFLKGVTLKAADTYLVVVRNIRDLATPSNVMVIGQGDTCSGNVELLPFVLQCAANTTAVSVTYSDPMNPTEVVDKANYKVFSPSSSTTPIDLSSAGIEYNPVLKVFHISGITLAGSYKVNVSNVTGSNGKPIDPGQSDCSGSVQTNPVTIESCDTNGSKVSVKFSRPVAEATAELAINYSLESPPGTPVSLANATVEYTDKLRLAVISGVFIPNNRDFKVSAVNVTDAGGNPMPLDSCTGTANTTPLTVLSCTPHEKSLIVNFSRPVLEEDAEGTSDATKKKDDYYKLESPTKTALSVNNTTITYDDASRSVTISNINWKVSATYLLTVTTLVRDQLLTAIGTPNTCSGAVPDESRPTVVCDYTSGCGTKWTSVDDKSVRVVYCDAGGGNVEETSASNPGNYTIEDTTLDPNVIHTPETITYSSGDRTATLTDFSPPLISGHALRITVRDVADLNGNVIDPNPTICSDKLVYDSTSPSVQACDATKSALYVTFTEDVNTTQAETKLNYTLDSPIGTFIDLGADAVVATYSSSDHKVTFSGLSLTEGANFRIKVQNVEDLGGLKIPQDGSKNICIGQVTDTTPPKLTGVKASAQQVEVTFSENVIETDAETKSFYQLTDLTSGQLVDTSPTTFDYSSTTLTTTITGLSLVTGHTLQVKMVSSGGDTIRDASPNQNKLDPSNPDNTRVVTIGTIKVISGSAGNTYVIVTYNESALPSGANSATDRTMFSLESPTGAGVSLANATFSYDSAAKKTTISGLTLATGNTFEVTVGAIKDATGVLTISPPDNVASGVVGDTLGPTFNCDVSEDQIDVAFTDDGSLLETEVKKSDSYQLKVGKPLSVVPLTGKTVLYDSATKVASITNLVLQPTEPYELTVSTNVKDTAGNSVTGTNPCTGTVTDSNPPRIADCYADNTSIAVTYSEQMQVGGSNGVDTISNYAVESPIGKTIQLDGKSVVYDSATRVVRIDGLSFTTGAAVQVKVLNVKDVSGTVIPDDGESNVCSKSAVDSLAPTIIECTAKESEVRVRFSEPVNTTDATTRANFALESPIGTAVSLSSTAVTFAYDDAADTTVISGVNLEPRESYKVRVINVRDRWQPSPFTVVDNGTTNVCSESVRDTVAPGVVGCRATALNISIIYSEPVMGADNRDHYTVLDGNTGAEISLSNALVEYDEIARTATISGLSLKSGVVVKVIVKAGVVDLSDNAIDPGRNMAICIVEFSVNLAGAPKLNLLSFPIVLQPADLAKLIDGNFALARWMPALNNGAGGYIFDNDSRFELNLGEGYWLNMDAAQSLVFREGTTAPTSDDFTVPLPSNNWFLLGNPWTQKLEWNAVDLRYRYAGVTNTLGSLQGNPSRPMEYYGWTWDGAAQDYVVVSDPLVLNTGKSALGVTECAWVRSYASGVQFILPSLSSAASALSVGERAGDLLTARPRVPSADRWSIELAAEAGDLRDRGNLLGVDSSIDGGEGVQIANPPMAPLRERFVELAFLGRSGSRNQGEELEVDLRSQVTARQSWDLLVTTTAVGSDVTISWGNLVQLPREYRLRLIDHTTGQRRALRTTSRYTFQSNSNGVTQRRFTIELYPSVEGGIRISNMRVVPGSRASAARARISYALSRGGEVDISILNTVGRVVRRLGIAQAKSGINAAVWDGRSNQGAVVPRGTYIIRVDVRDEEGQAFRAVRTITIK